MTKPNANAPTNKTSFKTTNRTVKTFSLNINGNLVTYDKPVVMGILNVTPDSFYAESRSYGSEDIEQRVGRLIAEGADMIDVGGYSTRPGANDVGVDEEIDRVARGIAEVRRQSATIPVSVDTFRPEVARISVAEMGANIINDISGLIHPDSDEMINTVAELGVPYILTHNRLEPLNAEYRTQADEMLATTLRELGVQINRLNLAGVNDVIVDPGIGFAKNAAVNFRILRELSTFKVLHCPVLIGISRKSLIYKTLETTPDDSLVGTTVLHTLCLERGANILRVHDVAAARQCVRILEATYGPPLISTNVVSAN